MLQGIDSKTGEFVVSIDPQWKTTKGPLRESCRRDAILCPECKQPVTLRAGDERIWHFAHRTDSGCPLKGESAAVLAAKVMLYNLLQEKFVERVGLEETIPGAFNAERADCVVTLDTGKIAYCIVEKQLRNRVVFMSVCKKAYASVQWILLPKMLPTAPEAARQFLLSATARELADRDGINQMYDRRRNIGSLCCADTERGLFLLARGLKCVHSPNVFEPSDYMEISPDEVIVSNNLGQLVSADEITRFKLRQPEVERRAAARREAEERMKRAEEAKRRRESRIAPPNAQAVSGSQEQAQEQSAVTLLTCLTCGGRFSEWECVQFDGCICKPCGIKERREMLRAEFVPKEQSVVSPAQGNIPCKKELSCLHCNNRTRDWVQYDYSADYPAGVCICTDCHAKGLVFPYGEGS
jgi:hypothetical protein